MIGCTTQINILQIDEDFIGHDSTPELLADTIAVFIANLDSLAGRLNSDGLYIGPEEQQRARRYRRPADHDHFVLRRGLLRLLLSRYLKRKPQEILFGETPNGKPCLAEGAERLEFSTSHSYGVAAYAFSTGHFVGIDIEKANPDLDCPGLAKQFFTADECARIKALDGEKQVDEFLRCWTRKEAYIKLFGPHPLNTIETRSADCCGTAPCGSTFSYYDIQAVRGYTGTLAFWPAGPQGT